MTNIADAKVGVESTSHSTNKTAGSTRTNTNEALCWLLDGQARNLVPWCPRSTSQMIFCPPFRCMGHNIPEQHPGCPTARRAPATPGKNAPARATIPRTAMSLRDISLRTNTHTLLSFMLNSKCLQIHSWPNFEVIYITETRRPLFVPRVPIARECWKDFLLTSNPWHPVTAQTTAP